MAAVPRAGQTPLQNLRYAGGQIDMVDATLGPGDPLSGHAYFVFAYEALTDLMWVLDGASLAKRAAPGGTLVSQRLERFNLRRGRRALQFESGHGAPAKLSHGACCGRSGRCCCRFNSCQ